MESITFNLKTLHQHGSAFWDFLALRKVHFVDQLGWDIPHDGEVEMDQYDNPQAHYAVVQRRGKVVGGARIMPTSATWGQHGYMLGDALNGLLEGIPPQVMPEVICRPETWECTRLVISDEVTTQAERAMALSLVVAGLVDVGLRNGARELISLSPLSLTRALRQLGYDASRLGEPYRNEHDGRRYAVLRMPALPALPMMTPKRAPVPIHADAA